MVTESGNMTNSVISSTNNESAGVKRGSDNRRSNKPIMEKRRRARINNCLNQLKTLILDAMKKDPARHSKLEKADILEMTVKYLQNVQQQQQQTPPNQQQSTPKSDPATANKFRAGFAECASEVGRFPGLEPPVKRRLLKHLATSLNNNHLPSSHTSPQTSPTPLASHESFPNLQNLQNQIILHNGVQLVQTRLPNGDIALMFPTTPAQHHGSASLPLLVPIPTRTSSTASASSSSSSHYSSSPESPGSCEPEAMEIVPMQRFGRGDEGQKPLSLVMRKESGDEDDDEEEDEKVWRPW